MVEPIIEREAFFPPLGSGAQLSPCRRYRFHLWRGWSEEGGRVAFLALNPLTADAEQDDPTVRRMIGFAKAWGYGGLDLVNLYAWRATDPIDLIAAESAGMCTSGGDVNDRCIVNVARNARRVIACWGAFPQARERGEEVAALLDEAGVPLECISWTKTGAPQHPLYLPRGVQPTPWRGYGPT